MNDKILCSESREENGDRPRRPSFRAAYDRARGQAGLEYLPREDAALGVELCKIIAEVYLLFPETVITISGEDIPAYVVQEVLEEITSEHIQYVIERIKNVRCELTSRKKYIRAMLYNSVFEIESGATIDANNSMI